MFGRNDESMMKKKNGNQGFSLVELVIVMAIMVIIGGFALTGLTLLSSRPVDECAKKIQMALDSGRNTTMGKLSATIAFYTDAEGNVYVEETINGATPYVKQIGQSTVKVQYMNSAGDLDVLDTTKLVMEFDRASGALKPQLNGEYIVSFVVSRGTAGERGYRKITVDIDKLTGRVTVE